MEKISILIITEYGKEYEMPVNADIKTLEAYNEDCKAVPDITFVDRNLSDEEYELVLKVSQVHRLFISECLTDAVKRENLNKLKCAKEIPSEKIASFIASDSKYFFKKPYGEKYRLTDITVSRNFKGSITFEGSNCIALEGDFGESLSQVLYFRNNIPIAAGNEIDFWLEYEKTGNVEISLEITAYLSGSVSIVFDKHEFSENELENIITYGNLEKNVSVFISIRAKGRGTLKFIALHDRFSRGNNGTFLVGGERLVTSKREEIFAYFEPGDLKPPLNIYFSGYKTREGFEGYNLMKNLGSPFLLLAEARLEGGAFYLGDEEYESLFLGVIKKYMDLLGFDGSKVIISGLSMGSFGALYYGCDIKPHAVILGKPLASIGDVALNEKRFRPGGFPTSLDVLKKYEKEGTMEAVTKLNTRMWDKYESADWSGTNFVVAYMIEDDYDSTAYREMISRLNDGGAAVYGKGIHGRHNDNTAGIVNWFVGQFEEIMTRDFCRSMKK